MPRSLVVWPRALLGSLALALGCGEGAPGPARSPVPADTAVAPLVMRSAVPAAAAAAQPLGGPADSARSAPPTHADPSDDIGPAGQGVPSRAALPAAAPGSNVLAAVRGYLDGTPRLAHLFGALAALDDGHAHDDVHVLQYGDSHTASDLGVGVFRRALQARFGDGGRGFVSVGKPWKSYVQDGVRGGMTKEFDPLKVKFHKDRTFTGIDGCYGLLGVGITASKAGARAWTDLTTPSSHIELAYGQDPSGGSFDVFIDGTRAGRVTTRASSIGSGWSAFDVPDAPHQVELRALGDGEIRVFGMNLDRAEAGIVVDALGINGAQIFTPLRWNEQHFAEQLRHASPDLVVLAYGTNEALEPGLADAEYERRLVDFLGRIARAAPAASCLLLGPPDLARHTKGQDDWRTWPRVREIASVQRRVAAAAGCAFYDQQEAMGGPGSIVAWAVEPESRAARDRIHLTRNGYAHLATALAHDLLRAYDDWRAERGLPPTSAPRTWAVAEKEPLP
jgi:lysophospholipase L1-like esterase